jgi:hypothetical protein
MKDTVSVTQAAGITGYHPSNIKQLFHAGELPGFQGGPRKPIRSHRSDVVALREQRYQEAGLEPVFGFDTFYAPELGWAVNVFKDENGTIAVVSPAQLVDGRVETSRHGGIAVWVRAITFWEEGRAGHPSRIKPIHGYPHYFVTNSGLVISVHGGEPRIVKPRLNRDDGYDMVNLSRDGRPKTASVHHLVYRTFKGEIPPGMLIRHLDSNPKNNHVDNLALGSHRDNARDACLAGTASRKLDIANIVVIRMLADAGWTQARLGKEFGVDRSCIGRILQREIWNWVP